MSTSFRLRRVVIVLVPTVVTLAITWLAPAYLMRAYLEEGDVTPAVQRNYVVLDYGVPLTLVAVTAWASVRFGKLAPRAATLAGSLVVIVGKLCFFAVLFALFQGDRSESFGEAGTWGTAIVLVLFILVVLAIARFGAWIGTLRLRPQSTCSIPGTRSAAPAPSRPSPACA